MGFKSIAKFESNINNRKVFLLYESQYILYKYEIKNI